MLTNSPVAAVLPAVDLVRAKKFYKNKLGLTQIFSDKEGVMYKAGKGTMIFVYKRKRTKAEHTVAAFMVKNLSKTMAELKSKGVKFQNYNLPGLKTVGGIFESGGHKSAWFKDTEGNILAIDQM